MAALRKYSGYTLYAEVLALQGKYNVIFTLRISGEGCFEFANFYSRDPGKGNGTRLLQDICALADKEKFYIELCVMMHNIRAQRLYVKAGFREMKRSESIIYMYYRPKER